jgi:hypothetical protein
MMRFPELPSALPDHLVPFTDRLRLAVAACLARFRGSSREYAASDLCCYLAWCGIARLGLRRHRLGSLRPGRYRDVVRVGPRQAPGNAIFTM